MGRGKKRREVEKRTTDWTRVFLEIDRDVTPAGTAFLTRFRDEFQIMEDIWHRVRDRLQKWRNRYWDENFD